MEYLLSLMIYCNYTNLQCEFSKTYRTGDRHKNNYNYNHDEFYHFGKNLKIAVHNFGTKIKCGKINRFYHGLHKVLQFPMYNGEFGNLIKIECPLSTSSEFSVAVNFGMDGMIVELRGNETRYFSVSWLSDFPAEKEYFFIQNKGLKFNNIWEISTGYEYQSILKALEFLTIITRNRDVEMIEIDEKMQTLIISIIHHQLSLTDSSYSPFKSLNPYAKTMIDTFFKQKRSGIEFHYNLMKEPKWKWFCHEFYYSKYEWIKLKNIIKIFPNLNEIHVYGIQLNESMFDQLLHQLQDSTNKLSLQKIFFFKYTEINHTTSWFVDKYQQTFEEIGWKLFNELEYDQLVIKSKQRDEQDQLCKKYGIHMVGDMFL
eukprot:365976_1